MVNGILLYWPITQQGGGLYSSKGEVIIIAAKLWSEILVSVRW